MQAFKLHFKKQLVTHVMACIDSCSSASEVSTGVTVLNVVTWIDKAWKAFTKFFHACGFQWLHDSNIPADSKIDKISSGVEAVQDLLGIAAASGMEMAMDVEEYMRFKREMPTEIIMDWELELVEQYKKYSSKCF